MPLTTENIHKVLSDLQRDGGKKQELEALLVNHDDYRALLESMPLGCVDKSKQTSMFGVKIISTDYIRPSCIFKIFKNDLLNENTTIRSPELKLLTVVWEKKRHSQTRKIRLD